MEEDVEQSANLRSVTPTRRTTKLKANYFKKRWAW